MAEKLQIVIHNKDKQLAIKRIHRSSGQAAKASNPAADEDSKLRTRLSSKLSAFDEERARRRRVATARTGARTVTTSHIRTSIQQDNLTSCEIYTTLDTRRTPQAISPTNIGARRTRSARKSTTICRRISRIHRRKWKKNSTKSTSTRRGFP
jgi:hypothetical protein